MWTSMWSLKLEVFQQIESMSHAGSLGSFSVYPFGACLPKNLKSSMECFFQALESWEFHKTYGVSHDFPRNMKTVLSQLLIHKEMSKIPLKFQQWPMFFQKKWLFPKNGIKCLNMFVFFNQCWPPKWLGQKWAPNWGTPIFEQWTFGIHPEVRILQSFKLREGAVTGDWCQDFLDGLVGRLLMFVDFLF